MDPAQFLTYTIRFLTVFSCVRIRRDNKRRTFRPFLCFLSDFTPAPCEIAPTRVALFWFLTHLFCPVLYRVEHCFSFYELKVFMSSEGKTPQNNLPEENPLIDMYMRKSWFARFSKALLTLLVLVAFALLAAWYGWQVLEPQERESWRGRYAVIQQADQALREHGLLPADDPLTPPQPEAASERIAKTSPAAEAVPLIDLSDPRVVDVNPKDHAKPIPARQEPKSGPKPAVIDMADINHKHRMKEILEPVRMLDDDGLAIVSSSESTIRERDEIVQKTLREGGLAARLKAWDSARRLTWEDFANQNTLDEKQFYGAYVSTSIKLRTDASGPLVFASMSPQRSWVRSGYANPRSLKHEQLHFDITEIYARKLRAHLSRIPNENHARAQEIYKAIVNEWRLAQKRYDDETHHGRRDEVQAKYEADVAEALTALADYYWKPKWRQSSQHAVAHFYRGQTYEWGVEGADQSFILARKAYNLGRQKKSPRASNNLARMYQFGLGVEKDERKAFRLYRSAANQGFDVAKFNLGVMYWRGIGTKPSREKAMELFTETAEKLTYARHALLTMEHGEQEPPQTVRHETNQE